MGEGRKLLRREYRKEDERRRGTRSEQKKMK